MHNIAILGYRNQASEHHAPAFARLPECRIVAVCDIVEERAKEGAERYSVPAYTDADEMLDREEVDLVDIPVGERFRYELVMNALRRGKHVFTEKPLVAADGQFKIKPEDVPVAREMIDEWQRHVAPGRGAQFGICFGLHASPNVQRVREVIASGELGEVRHIQARTHPGPWNHIIDLVRFFGGEVEEVSALADDADALTNKAACLRFENGAVGTLSFCGEVSLQFQIKWIGTLGEATIDNIAGTATWRRHDSLDVTHWQETSHVKPATYHRIFEDLIADYVASIDDGRPFVADGWAGLRHVEIDAAITESMRSGKPVRVARYLPDKGRRPFP